VKLGLIYVDVEIRIALTYHNETQFMGESFRTIYYSGRQEGHGRAYLLLYPTVPPHFSEAV
jgi:hypothetical protein